MAFCTLIPRIACGFPKQPASPWKNNRVCKQMEFSVLKLTANGNLLMKGSEPRGASGMDLFEAGKKAATVFDTIGSIESPLYLAKPHVEAKILVGKTLSSVR